MNVEEGKRYNFDSSSPLWRDKRSEFFSRKKLVIIIIRPGLYDWNMVQPHGAPSEKPGGEKKASAISSFMQNTKALLYNMYQRSNYGGADPRPVYSDTELWLLGEAYHAVASSEEAQEAFLVDFGSRVWCTYRQDFSPLPGGGGHTSDLGWGCMVRTAQMMLAHALLLLFVGRGWRRSLSDTSLPPSPSSATSSSSQLTPPSASDSPAPVADLSVTTSRKNTAPPTVPSSAARQRMQLGSTQRTEGGTGNAPERLYRGILKWFAESAATSAPYSLHNVVRVATKSGYKSGETFAPTLISQVLKVLVRRHAPAGMTFHVPTDGVVYVDCVRALCTSPLQRSRSPPPLRTPESLPDPLWRPLVLFIPLRLGMHRINPLYVAALQQFLTWPQSLGFIGGKPNLSFYFVGWQDDKIFYLDPHIVQRTRTDGTLGSYHCAAPKQMPFAELDPSLAVGFFCQDRAAFDDLVGRIRRLLLALGPDRVVVHVEQTDPHFDLHHRRDSTVYSDEEDDTSPGGVHDHSPLRRTM